MFQEFQIPEPNSSPREILATNQEQILERVSKGIPLMRVHHRLNEFLGKHPSVSPVIYQTFRRFVIARNPETTVQHKELDKAEKGLESQRSKSGIVPSKSKVHFPDHLLRKTTEKTQEELAEEFFGSPPPSSQGVSNPLPDASSKSLAVKSDTTAPKPGYDENGFPILDTSKGSPAGIFYVPPLRPEDF